MKKTLIAAGALALGTLSAVEIKSQPKFYSDDPVMTMPKPVSATGIKPRSLSEYYDFFENSLFTPGERAKHGQHLQSQGINTIDEVPDSAWYTNRHASRRMTLDELRRGAGDESAPAPGVLTVIAAKNEGITPGFRVRDAAGRKYLIKFDPPSNPEMASAADVIASKFFYALGYNVPENYIVNISREQIAIGEGAMFKDETGRKRAIHPRDIDEMLAKAPRSADGTYRALASLLISGKPLGPFKYDGMRSDDPNDLVPHEHRRDLRALRTFCAWVGHDDSKALNSLDLLVKEDGVDFVKHYLIDFGASLGSATFRANSPRDGNVYLFDWKSSAQQFLTLGLSAPKWQRAKYPNLPSVGRFEYEVFDPAAWVGDYPSAAFVNENPSDRMWAARKIAAFTDDEIRAMVATGRYSDPAAADWVSRCLIARRDKIVKAFLSGTAALDAFEVRDGRLIYRGGEKTEVAVQWSAFNNRTSFRKHLHGERSTTLPAAADGKEYVVAELTGPRGPAISVYVSMKGTPRVVGVERHFDSAPPPIRERNSLRPTE